MPRKAPSLSPARVSRLKEPGFYRVGTVAGLALQITPTAARTWVLRYEFAGRRRDMGLGGYPEVPLAKAWEKAREARDKLRAGIDPIDERRAARSALKAAQALALTFKQAARDYIAAHSSAWKNPKHRAQWAATLAEYAYPVIGNVPVRDLEIAHMTRVLEPIWQAKTETASRLRGRIERVLDWATVRGYRSGPNPARWKGNLDTLLPAPARLARNEHHAALPLGELGAFMAELRRREGTAARALEFAILTAARSGEVRGALWGEIDLGAKVWTVPSSRMKAQREHRVPLSERAVELLRRLPRAQKMQLVFAAPNGGTLSDMSLGAVMRRMNDGAEDQRPRWIDPRSGKPVVPHGLRSTFRDWASERTNYPREVTEMALAHRIDDKVEAAYRRGDLFDKRRRMMNDWARFCARIPRKGRVTAGGRGRLAGGSKGG
jgi:integrase